jgi:uncharacterized protein YgiB involved in biofilm formation
MKGASPRRLSFTRLHRIAKAGGTVYALVPYLSGDGMKRSRTASLVVMGLSPLFISACDDTHKSQQAFTSVDACTRAGVPADTCQSAYDRALQQASGDAPHYANESDCWAGYEQNTCVESLDPHGNTYWAPGMTAFLIARVLRNGGTSYYPAGPVFRKRDLSDYSPRYGGVYAGGGSGWRSVSSGEVAGEGDTVSRGGFGGEGEGGHS